MTVTLPPGEGMPSNHDAFPNPKAYIEGIEDTVINNFTDLFDYVAD